MKRNLFLFTMTIGLTGGGLIFANNDSAQPDASQKAKSSQSSSQSSDAQQGIAQQSGGAESKSGTKMSLDQLPPNVQKTIRAHSRGFNVENVQKKTMNGQTVYTASYDRDNMRTELAVNADGSLQEMKQSQDFALGVELPKIEKSDTKISDLPSAVQQTIKREAASAEVGNISKTDLGGKTAYHAAFNQGGVHNDLFVGEDGKVVAQSQQTELAIIPIENHQTASLNDAPEKVQQAVRQNAPKGEITDFDKGTWKGETVYRAMVNDNGKLSQFVISEKGTLIPQAEDISKEAAGAEKKSGEKQNEPKSGELKPEQK